MSRRAILTIAGVIALAIAALLAYSLDRTAWLFTLYEHGQANAATLGMVAALVAEIAVVALVAGEGAAGALGLEEAAQATLRHWAGRGLAAVLLVQIVA